MRGWESYHGFSIGVSYKTSKVLESAESVVREKITLSQRIPNVEWLSRRIGETFDLRLGETYWYGGKTLRLIWVKYIANPPWGNYLLDL